MRYYSCVDVAVHRSVFVPLKQNFYCLFPTIYGSCAPGSKHALSLSVSFLSSLKGSSPFSLPLVVLALFSPLGPMCLLPLKLVFEGQTFYLESFSDGHTLPYVSCGLLTGWLCSFFCALLGSPQACGPHPD